MRIGLLIDSLIGGGAERITLNFADTFAAMGHDVHVFVLRDEIRHVFSGEKFKLHILTKDGRLSDNSFMNKRKLNGLFKATVFDIESSDARQFDFFISSSVDFDEITRDIPNVFVRYRNSMWNFIQNKLGNKRGVKRFERKLRHTLRHRYFYSGRHIIAITDAMRDDLCVKVGIRPKTITTIYNPFDFDFIRNRAQEICEIIPKEPFILYAAKFENRKRHDVLVDAFAMSQLDMKLVLIGEAYTESDQQTLEKLKRQIDSLGLNDKILFPGFQTNPYPWMKRAAIFAMTSDSEGLPTVLIESLILGTPVVSTDCPTGPSEILTGELSAFLVPVADSRLFAEKLKLAQLCYPTISDDLIAKFDNRKVAEQYLSYCSAVVASMNSR
jgi:glycosyltransferase involved in cell wall biosynthesis